MNAYLNKWRSLVQLGLDSLTIMYICIVQYIYVCMYICTTTEAPPSYLCLVIEVQHAHSPEHQGIVPLHAVHYRAVQCAREMHKVQIRRNKVDLVSTYIHTYIYTYIQLEWKKT